MTYCPDLSPCTYFGEEYADAFVAVGWLAAGHDFHKGPADPACLERLLAFSRNPWQFEASMGFHKCELCVTKPHRFGDNLFIPSDDVIFVAPAGITHYMSSHDYSPPEPFCKAVAQCPDVGSPAYFSLIAATRWADIGRKLDRDQGEDFDAWLAEEERNFGNDNLGGTTVILPRTFR